MQNTPEAAWRRSNRLHPLAALCGRQQMPCERLGSVAHGTLHRWCRLRGRYYVLMLARPPRRSDGGRLHHTAELQALRMAAAPGLC